MKSNVKWFLVDINKKEKYHINSVISVMDNANQGIFMMHDNPNMFKGNKTLAILKEDGDLYIYKKAKNNLGFRLSQYEPTEEDDFDNPDVLSLYFTENLKLCG